MNTTKSPLPETLRTTFANRKVYNPAGDLVDLHSNVSEAEAAELYEAVRELKPAFSLEGVSRREHPPMRFFRRSRTTVPAIIM